jgi:hypothetical protein
MSLMGRSFPSTDYTDLFGVMIELVHLEKVGQYLAGIIENRSADYVREKNRTPGPTLVGPLGACFALP